MVEKLIRDGRVAVVYSPGWGSAWSTNEQGAVRDMLMYDKDIVLAVLEGDVGKAKEIAIAKYEEITGEAEFYAGHGDLEVEWVKIGERFRISSFDGSEAVMTVEDYVWMVA